MVRLAVLFVTVILLSACSSLYVFYSFADNYLARQASTYLELDEEDEAFVDARIAAFMDWHREEMLPKYARFLRAQANVAAANRPDREDVARAVSGLRALVDETIRGLTPHMAEVLLRHANEEKLAAMETRMAEHMAEQLEEENAETREERIAESVDRTGGNFERFLGELTKEQDVLIKAYAEERAAGPPRWLLGRQARQRAMVDFLRGGPSADQLRPFLDRVFLEPERFVAQADREYYTQRLDRLQSLIVDVVAAMTEEQRRHLVDTLRGYADDLVRLSS